MVTAVAARDDRGMSKLRRPSPALVVASIALFAAGAGSATAGSLITSKQIRNNSVTGADIKNRSIKAKDLARSAIPTTAGSGVAGSNGSDGAPGPIGPKGEKGETGGKGDTGDRGPSSAKMVHRDAAFDLDNPTNFEPAEPRGATMQVGGGDYVAFGKVLISVPGDRTENVTCRIAAPGAQDTAFVKLSDRDTDNAAGDANSRSGDVKETIVALQTAFTAPSGTSQVSLTCAEQRESTIFDEPGTTPVVTAEQVKLTAIQVDALDVAAVTG